ncbi:MAG: mevalonate kinase family protein [Promethearchaeota archaeon]
MIRIKAPGRICLFGEHQDYLNYPIIAMAISRYIYLEAKRISENKFIINFPDINNKIEIELKNKELIYESKRDYIRSGYNQFLRLGAKFEKGYKITITGDIPINAGAASSSALVIAWLTFLNEITELHLTKEDLANLGYKTEVQEFGEAGGKMDFFSSVFGNLIHLTPQNNSQKLIEIPISLEGFVLGNSLEKKDTVEDLRRVKSTAKRAFEIIRELMPDFNQFKTKLNEIEPYLPSIEKKYREKLVGNIINRDITEQAKDLILTYASISKSLNYNRFKDFYEQLGNLINAHQKELKEKIKISTKKIDLMIDRSIEVGALGAKINGSGFGGTMFALAPGKESEVIGALINLKCEAYKINTSCGVEKY